jgi:predicted ribosome quality control (RQC) complex YloA/Tae2 family protein
MQPVDFTTLTAVCWELRTHWLPARLEQVYQSDRHTLALALRTLQGRHWLTLSWHPQAARLHLGDPPPRDPDTFTFSKQLQSQLKGLALSTIEPITAWERALDLQFAPRPQEPPHWHLYLEVMGKYSNAILVNGENEIITAAHQVGQHQSRIRPIQTGQPFVPPPVLQNAIPRPEEPFDRWQEQVNLIPGPIAKTLVQTYRGLSSHLARSLVEAAGLDPDQTCDRLSQSQWQQLFQSWQDWLKTLETRTFEPGWTGTGYTVMGWGMKEPVETVQSLLNQYYGDRLNQQQFQQLRHQLHQKVKSQLQKIQQKAQGFRQRLQESEGAENYQSQGDLLMANLHQWESGLRQIALADFETGELRRIALDPEKNAVQNAQALYKQHQKLKRAKAAVQPLLRAVEQEINYLEQVETSLGELEAYQTADDLLILQEIREELIQQGYWRDPDLRERRGNRESHSPKSIVQSNVYRYRSPSGFELLVGRNNRQNDWLTFRLAKDYDLWFHTQEIPGSHGLLRLDPGAVADEADLQYAADVLVYHSRARQSDQAPVVYTQPRHVYKPKGAAPGMVIYKHEQVIWGKPGNLAPS